jgi:ABC-type branched-subunit amino acid transport system substrate-binding protein
VEDSQGTPQGGATGVTKLINVEHAIYIMLGFTGVSKAAAPIAARSKTVLVNGGGVGPDLANLMPYFWNVIPLANFEVQGLMPWVKSQGIKRMVAVYVDDPAGNAIVKELRTSLPGAGAELAAAFSVAPSAQQFGGVTAQVREANADAIYLASYGAQQVQIVKQLRDAGLNQPFASYSAVNVESMWKLPDAEGTVFTSQATNWDSDDTVTKRFVTDWRKKYNTDPVTYNQNYYNAVRLFGLLGQALEKAGTPINGDSLRAELLKTRRFPMVGGEGVFDDNGTMSMPIQLNQIKGGRVVKLG